MQIRGLANSLAELEPLLQTAVRAEKLRLTQKATMLKVLKIVSTAEGAIEQQNAGLVKNSLVSVLNRFFPASYPIE